MKILFMGTPEPAVPFLETCARRHQVLAAVTQPDRPSGRGLEVRPTPVKAAARRLSIPVLQPERPSLIADGLRDLGADLSVVVAYGKLLKPDVLSATRLGHLNVHFSLLPRYRGAAPVPWSLIRGETKTGVTLFWLDEGMDTGPVQARREIEIGVDDDAPELMRKLIAAGTPLLEQALEDIAQGRVHREPQAGEPSLAPRLTREDARVSFAAPALDIHNRIRGLRGGPKAFVTCRGGPARRPGALAPGRGVAVALLKSACDPGSDGAQGEPGTLVRVEKERGILIQCRSSRLWIKDVQPEGKKHIPAGDFANGLRLKPGDLLVSNE